MSQYRPVSQLRSASAFREYLDTSAVPLTFDEHVLTGAESALGQPYRFAGRTIGNRFAILPMEGWDAEPDGRPSPLTARRWQHFGLSGAKLIFGGEAVAPRRDARANPHGLVLTDETLPDIAALRAGLVETHRRSFGSVDDLMVGMQVSHAGRFSRPDADGKPRPRIIYRHPILDARMGIDSDAPVITDLELGQIIEDCVHASVLAQRAGFDFVDVKACHGYLGHETLGAVDRPGTYGGSLENRTRFLRELIRGIMTEAPGLHVAVRLSAFDCIPFQAGADGVGEPVRFDGGRYPYAFGGDGTGTGVDLSEPLVLLDQLSELGVRLLCITASCGYYCYHLMRPCLMPAAGAYLPPEEPLRGVARLVNTAEELKHLRPEFTYVSSGYSYLQEWLPNVAQERVRMGRTDFVGIGRMVLSYPEMPADIIAGRPLRRNAICRGCTRCLTAARKDLPAGCYLTDDFYRSMPGYEQVKRLIQK